MAKKLLTMNAQINQKKTARSGGGNYLDIVNKGMSKFAAA